MIYLELFITFLKIGLFSFGGGYGMLPLMEQEVVAHSWMTSADFLNFVAVSESTPGPIAVNMATFIGSSKAGIFGAACSTIGVILPSIVIILLIVAVFKNFLKSKIVSSALSGVKPVIVGLIFVTGVWLGLKNVLPDIANFSAEGFSPIALVITASAAAVFVGYKLIFKKKMSPILLIVFSAALGMILF